MAGFPPLKRYVLFCLDQLIAQHSLSGPFLDIGCGCGDVSAHLAAKGWKGKAIDDSPFSIEQAQECLSSYPNVKIEQKSLFLEEGKYRSVFMLDVLEHIEEDEEALKMVSRVTEPGGFLVLAVPSNPKEWRWDDDFYGHIRRYTKEEINKKLEAVGFKTLLYWDFTYPFFWAMRRLYTFLKPRPKEILGSSSERTKMSTSERSWEIPGISWLLGRDYFIWKWMYQFMFKHFKERIDLGHEMFVLAQKK